MRFRAVLFGVAAAGAAIYNNWAGLGKAFVTFKAGFMAALGPEAQAALSPPTGLLYRIGQLWESLTRKRSDGQLMMWGYGLGRSLGEVAAHLKSLGPLLSTAQAAWDAFAKWVRTGSGDLFANTKREFEFWWNLPSKIVEIGVEFGQGVKKLAQSGFDALVSFEWSKAGAAIVGAIVTGVTSASARLVDAVRGLASRAVSGVAGALGLGAGTSGPPRPPPGLRLPPAPLQVARRLLRAHARGAVP
ncbi:hypothetical protein [Methylobacterium sp.]|uniref:hypothetical protein n=1 Tax=Methylobacterium sp. TaxID=409 RepID=UPI0025CBD755|nr:hypothetical protein [Methylobacterium sp.]MBY0260131.1 hypothetical protein [Methylobacterium sp.]